MIWNNKSQLEQDLKATKNSMFLKRKDVAEILGLDPRNKRVSRILQRAKARHDFGSIYAISDIAEAIWQEQK